MNLALYSILQSNDTAGISEYLPEAVITARSYDFRNYLDMNTPIRMRQFRNLPAPFDDTRFIVMLSGGVAPLFDALSVRGGGIADNMITINGIPIITPHYRLLHFLPLDRDAIDYMEFYRGDMPPEYDGFLSALLKVHLTERVYAKVGLTSISGNLRGFHWDFFYTPIFFPKDIGMENLFAAYVRGHFSTIYMRDFLRIARDIRISEGDTLKYLLKDNQTWGASIEWKFLHIYISHESRFLKVRTLSQGESISASDRTIAGIRAKYREWGAGLQFHRYIFHPDDEEYYNLLNLSKTCFSISMYRRWGKFFSAGLTYFSQGKILPLVRAGYKHFADSTTAFRIFFGTSGQGFIPAGYPIFEKYISRDKVSMGYTLIGGMERLLPGKSFQINAFARYFRPYYSLLFFLFPPEMGFRDSIVVFSSTPILSFGMDMNYQDYEKGNLNVSLTLQRSLFTENWKPTPYDIRFVLYFQYRYLSAMFIDGIVRWDILLQSENPYESDYRESPMYIYSFMFPFRWKGFHFRIGVYNFIPQIKPENELSAIYRAFPIPILSVRREF